MIPFFQNGENVNSWIWEIIIIKMRVGSLQTDKHFMKRHKNYMGAIKRLKHSFW